MPIFLQRAVEFPKPRLGSIVIPAPSLILAMLTATLSSVPPHNYFCAASKPSKPHPSKTVNRMIRPVKHLGQQLLVTGGAGSPLIMCFLSFGQSLAEILDKPSQIWASSRRRIFSRTEERTYSMLSRLSETAIDSVEIPIWILLLSSF